MRMLNKQNLVLKRADKNANNPEGNKRVLILIRVIFNL